MSGLDDRRLWRADYRRTAKAVLDRDRHLCRIQGPRCTRDATQVDHIVARADGGSDDFSNLRAACAACNGWLAARRTNSMPGRRYRISVPYYETRL